MPRWEHINGESGFCKLKVGDTEMSAVTGNTSKVFMAEAHEEVEVYYKEDLHEDFEIVAVGTVEELCYPSTY